MHPLHLGNHSFPITSWFLPDLYLRIAQVQFLGNCITLHDINIVKEHAWQVVIRTWSPSLSLLRRSTLHSPFKVKEAIHIRLHPDNINRDSGIEIPGAWMPTIKKYNNRRAVRQRTAEGGNRWVKQQGSKFTNQSCWKTTKHSRALYFKIMHDQSTSSPKED